MKSEAGDVRLDWQRRLAPVLAPTAWCYAGLQRARRYAYRRRWIAAFDCGKPVVSVGSLLAGGSGKTPFIAHLAGRLAEHHAAILSRGFGGRTRHPLEVNANSDARQCGDEPVLLARTTPAAVWVGRRRAQLARQLAGDYDLFLLDDGYQHLALHRTLNMCLVPDLPRSAILPAGLWREGPSALKDADFVVCVDGEPGWLAGALFTGPVGTVEFVPGDGRGDRRRPSRRRASWSSVESPVPSAFWLRSHPFEIVATVLFKDHHHYTAEELGTLWERASAEWRPGAPDHGQGCGAHPPPAAGIAALTSGTSACAGPGRAGVRALSEQGDRWDGRN